MEGEAATVWIHCLIIVIFPLICRMRMVDYCFSTRGSAVDVHPLTTTTSLFFFPIAEAMVKITLVKCQKAARSAPTAPPPLILQIRSDV